ARQQLATVEREPNEVHARRHTTPRFASEIPLHAVPARRRHAIPESAHSAAEQVDHGEPIVTSIRPDRKRVVDPGNRTRGRRSYLELGSARECWSFEPSGGIATHLTWGGTCCSDAA